MFQLLTIDVAKTLIAQAWFCPHPNGRRIIASIPLILLLVGIVGAIGFIISTIVGAVVATLSLLKIVAFFVFLSQIPTFAGELAILGGLTGIMVAVVRCIQILSGCG